MFVLSLVKKHYRLQFYMVRINHYFVVTICNKNLHLYYFFFCSEKIGSNLLIAYM